MRLDHAAESGFLKNSVVATGRLTLCQREATFPRAHGPHSLDLTGREKTYKEDPKLMPRERLGEGLGEAGGGVDTVNFIVENSQGTNKI